MSKKGVYGDADGDTGFRRKFNVADYHDKERELEKKKQPAVIRDHLELEAVVNKTKVVTAGGSISSRAGIYCEHCNLNFSDNMAYLEHQRSKMHQRNIGLSLTVRHATLQDVRDKFEELRQRKALEKEEFGKLTKKFQLAIVVKDFDKRLQMIKEYEEQAKEDKKRRKKEIKEQRLQEEIDAKTEEDFDMAAVLGFSDFGSTKR